MTTKFLSLLNGDDGTVILSKNPKGIYLPLQSDYNNDLKVSIGTKNQTAFGEILTGQLTPVLQELFTYNINPRVWNTPITNSASVSTDQSMAKISTGLTALSRGSLQSRKHIRYRPGTGIVARFTGLFTPGIADSEQIIGIGDEDDGFFFGYNGTDFGILHRNNASGALVDTWIPQTTWNSDKCDGGDILSNVDWSKGNVFEIRFQYLGFGTIKFYVENNRTGEFVLVHSIKYSGVNSVPSLANPSLPFHAEVYNGNNTTDLILYSGSVGLFVEGKNTIHGITNSVFNSKAGINNIETNILTIQNKATFLSKTNHNLVYPRILNINSVSGTKPSVISIKLNSVLGGVPVFNDVDVNNSIVSYDVAGTTVADGYLMSTNILGKETGVSIDLHKLGIFLEAGDTLTISASTSSGSVELFCSITFTEDI